LGREGSGLLDIRNGGLVTSMHTSIGVAANGGGAATVTGADSQWLNAGYLTVGMEGTGTLAITDGGMLTSEARTTIGRYVGSEGSMTVTGSGSTWFNNDELAVADEGSGTLDIVDGGEVTTAGTVFIGASASGVGAITIGN